MRFRTNQRPRGLLKTRDQWRLILLTIAVSVVLIGSSVARRPELWAGFFPHDPVVKTDTTPNPMTGPVTGQPASVESKSRLLHDEFWVGENSGEAASHDTVNHRTMKVGDKKTGLTYDDRGLPQLPRRLVADVKDNVIGIHSTESTAYHDSMTLASKLDENRSAKAEPGTYALFIDAPNTARGRAFKISGKLRRLTLVKGRLDAVRIGNVYDAWLNTSDSGEQMLHVIASSVDNKLARLLPVDDRDQSIDFAYKTAPDIHFTGYFFKKEAYASQNETGLSVAPMFVTNTITKTSLQRATTGRAEKLTPYLSWLTMIILAAVALIVWSFSVSDAAHASTRTHQLTRLPAVASFDDIESETVDETLRRLEAANANASVGN